MGFSVRPVKGDAEQEVIDMIQENSISVDGGATWVGLASAEYYPFDEYNSDGYEAEGYEMIFYTDDDSGEYFAIDVSARGLRRISMGYLDYDDFDPYNYNMLCNAEWFAYFDYPGNSGGSLYPQDVTDGLSDINLDEDAGTIDLYMSFTYGDDMVMLNYSGPITKKDEWVW
jgi:hypothetical protein